MEKCMKNVIIILSLLSALVAHASDPQETEIPVAAYAAGGTAGVAFVSSYFMNGSSAEASAKALDSSLDAVFAINKLDLERHEARIAELMSQRTPENAAVIDSRIKAMKRAFQAKLTSHIAISEKESKAFQALAKSKNASRLRLAGMGFGSLALAIAIGVGTEAKLTEATNPMVEIIDVDSSAIASK
jgi:hypothetical protein